MSRTWPLALLAFAAVAVGQGFRQRPDNVVVRPDDVMNTYHLGPYNATTGVLFDAGYLTNAIAATAYPSSVEGAKALVAAECEARMARDGVNNARSNIFSLEDDNSGRRVTALVTYASALDAGVQVSHSSSTTMVLYWRPLAGGDAGMPWMLSGSMTNPPVLLRQQGTAGTGLNPGLTFNSLSIVDPNHSTLVSNGPASIAWAPGYYCLLPLTSGGYGTSHFWVRINRVFDHKP